MGDPGTKQDLLSLEDLEAAGALRTGRKHVLSILVENKPGVLTRIAGLFARRGFNIETLTVGPTDDDQISRVTLTVANTGDRPIQVGSHYHFVETNPALRFERERARASAVLPTPG